MYHPRKELFHPLPGCCRNGNYRNPQCLFQSRPVDTSTLPPQFVHQIEGDHHWKPSLQKLHGEVEVPLQVRGVNHIDNDLHLPSLQKAVRDHFLGGIGR